MVLSHKESNYDLDLNNNAGKYQLGYIEYLVSCKMSGKRAMAIYMIILKPAAAIETNLQCTENLTMAILRS